MRTESKGRTSAASRSAASAMSMRVAAMRPSPVVVGYGRRGIILLHGIVRGNVVTVSVHTETARRPPSAIRPASSGGSAAGAPQVGHADGGEDSGHERKGDHAWPRGEERQADRRLHHRQLTGLPRQGPQNDD